MNRSAFKALAACVLLVFFFCGAYGADKKRSEVFCVGDTIVTGNKGSFIYSDLLRNMLEKQYGSKKISVFNYSFYNMNTAQGMVLIADLIKKQPNTEFVVLMAGEGNFYNLAGYCDYLKSKGAYTPQNAFIDAYDIDALEKLNTGVASMYNSPKAFSKKASMKYIVSTAYRSIAGVSPKRIGGYRPEIVPAFVALSYEGRGSAPAASLHSKYRLAWNYINGGRYGEAEEILKDMLKENPMNSNIYYALGSLYLLKDNGNANEALKMFEEGVLVNPFDKNNQCYKGLSAVYMSYDGRTVHEVLYFVRVIKSYIGERIPEINAIAAMNTADFNKKISAINDWMVSDIRKINAMCAEKGIDCIVADYPFEAKANAVLRGYFSFSPNITFVSNSNAEAGGAGGYAKAAENIAQAIKKIKKK